MLHELCGAKSQDSVHKWHKLQFFEEKGEPKRIEPRSFCLPAKRLTARPHRLTHPLVSFRVDVHWILASLGWLVHPLVEAGWIGWIPRLVQGGLCMLPG